MLPAGLALAWSAQINPWQAPTALALAGIGVLSRQKLPNPKELGPALIGFSLPLLLLLPRQPGMFQGLSFEVSGHTNLMEALQVFGWLLPCIPACLRVRRPRWMLLLLLLCAGMFAACEGVRVVDVFQNRMNTVFKVYYQLWVLLGLAAAAGAGVALQRRWRFPAIAALTVTALGLVYAARLSGHALSATHRTLDPLSAESQAFQNRVRLAGRLIRPGDRIAEAPGDSYQPHHSHLGTWTAGANVIGWLGHEQQWRADLRPPSLLTLYMAPDPASLEQALFDLDVQWVWIGQRERSLYSLHPDLTDWLDLRYNRVIDQPGGALWRIP
jgi:uncharacterized membrane protein